MSVSLSSTFSFSGEDFGVAGAAGLRKVTTLAETAPKGRLFESITTLTESSAAATAALEAGDLPRAHHAAAKLMQRGEFKLPSFFKRKG